MTETSVAIVLQLEGAADADLAREISQATGAETRALTTHGFDGDVMGWLLVGNFIVSSLATLAPILAKYLGDRRVKSIKVGDLVVENPQDEDVARILRAWGAGDHGHAQ